MQVTYGKTKQGKPCVIHNGYQFNQFRDLDGGLKKWRCNRYGSGCPSMLWTAGDDIKKGPTDHNHLSDPGRVNAQQRLHEMKEDVTSNVSALPTEVVSQHMRTADEETKLHMAHSESLKRILRCAEMRF